MLKKAIFSLIISTLLLFTGCGEKQEIVPKIEIKDGVKFVHNDEPLWGDNPKIELKFVRQIGVFEGPDDNYMFFIPTDFAVDNEGNIYVLDIGNFRIQKFDPNGNYVTTLGRKGVGPAEFTILSGIDAYRDGNLLVANYVSSLSTGGGFYMVLSPDGKELRRLKIEARSNTLVLSDGSFINKSEDIDNLLQVYDSEGTPIKTIGKYESTGNSSVDSYMRAFLHTRDIHDNFYITFKYRNLIEKYSPDNELVFRIDRPLNYDTEFEVKENTIKRQLPNGGTEKYKYYSVKTKDVSQAIAVDGKERIWVVTYNRQEKSEERAELFVTVAGYESGVSGVSFRTNGNTDITETDMYILEVFDKEGILLTHFPITHFIDGMRIYGDRLFILDKLRTMTIFEYKIIDL